MPYTLFGNPGWGSAIVEAQLAWYEQDCTMEEVGDLFASAPARERLRALNPVAQVPTLILPDGSVMTESAAITLHLADVTGSDSLAPGAADPVRPRFLRWLVFLVANIYPTFTFADDPSRFVADPEAQKAFRTAVDDYRKSLWESVEREAAGEWFLGRFSALDIYVGVMTCWHPRRAWFAEHCPRIHAIALRAESEPRLAATWRRNFPQD
ncbi:MAG TPA: glutathione S-transferase [Stellaceae bacterium]|nr:glutathione S-transferase [Stellaceae bacterium]